MHRWFNTQQVTLVPELNSENVRRISSDAISAAAHCVSHSDGAEWPLHLRWCELAHHNNLLSTVLQYETLILCCIVTPTGQLTRRLLYRLLHRLDFSVCFFAWVIADCALHCPASQSGAFAVCALLCCSHHPSCLTPCFDLSQVGEQSN